MKKRNIHILLIFLVFMISISAVSAAEDTASDLTSMDDNEEIILEAPSDGSALNDANEELILEDNDVNEDLKASKTNDIPNADSALDENQLKDTLQANPDEEILNTQIKLNIIVTAEDIKYGETAIINVSMIDGNGEKVTGKVNVTIKGETKEVNVTNGVGSVEIPNLNAGKYSIIARHNGNETYSAALASTSFSVKKIISKIIYEDMTTTAVDTDTDGRIGKYFVVTLTDSAGKALTNKPIQIGFNGKAYNRTTDENGQAQLQINLQRADIYTFAIAFLGDENCDGAFEVAKITVNKQKGSLTVPNKSYSASAKTKSLTATFKAASGKVVANKKISFTVNGKTYSATTNSKGVATVKVSLSKKGSYSFTAKFAGDGTYAAISKTAKLTLK